MFEHYIIMQKHSHRAHGFQFSIWVLNSMETGKKTAFVSRISQAEGEPVGVQSISADESFSIENLIGQAIEEIDSDNEQIYST